MNKSIQTFKVSVRRACRLVGISRSAYKYLPKEDPFSTAVEKRVVELATQYGRYGYRQITGIMRNEGWDVGKDKVYRIWRKEGLKVPKKQPKRRRLWLADGSYIRKRAEYKNHVWSYDFVSDQTHDGRKFRILNIIDEYTRECLVSHCARRIRSKDVMEVLSKLFLERGVPVHIRSDNGPEFVAKKLVRWLKVLNVSPLFISPGSPWENGYCESFNGKMRYELLNGEIFYSMTEAKIIINEWVYHYNRFRPHSALGGRPPAPETKVVNFDKLKKKINN